MIPLSEKTCSACRIDAPKVTPEQIQAALTQLPDWKLVKIDSIEQLKRTYKVKNFVEAMALSNAIGLLAEEYNHHPALLTEWGKVTVNWWTHKINGLHENDLIMAAKTEKLFQRYQN